MCRRAITSTPLGRMPTGGRITRDCGRSRRNTIPTVSSSSTTVWAAKTGAPTALHVLPNKILGTCSHDSDLPSTRDFAPESPLLPVATDRFRRQRVTAVGRDPSLDAAPGAIRANPAPVYDACTMTPCLTLEQALGAPGLRVAPVRGGLPSPWSEFVRACFHVKRIPCSLVDARDADRGLTSIKTLTGQESLPVVFWNDERPRSNWLEQLVLAERISLKPRLLPDDRVERAKVVGLIAELCSEAGFGWHRRGMMIARLPNVQTFGHRQSGNRQDPSHEYPHNTEFSQGSTKH